MSHTLFGVWALLLGIVPIMLGNGMHFAFIGLRGGIEGFSAAELAVVTSGSFAGFLAGARYAPVPIRRVGHMGVFAALGSFMSAGLIAFALSGGPGQGRCAFPGRRARDRITPAGAGFAAPDRCQGWLREEDMNDETIPADNAPAMQGRLRSEQDPDRDDRGDAPVPGRSFGAALRHDRGRRGDRATDGGRCLQALGPVCIQRIPI